MNERLKGVAIVKTHNETLNRKVLERMAQYGVKGCDAHSLLDGEDFQPQAYIVNVNGYVMRLNADTPIVKSLHIYQPEQFLAEFLPTPDSPEAIADATKQRNEAFDGLSLKILAFLNSPMCHPHMTIIADCNHVELVEGVRCEVMDKSR